MGWCLKLKGSILWAPLGGLCPCFCFTKRAWVVLHPDGLAIEKVVKKEVQIFLK